MGDNGPIKYESATGAMIDKVTPRPGDSLDTSLAKFFGTVTSPVWIPAGLLLDVARNGAAAYLNTLTQALARPGGPGGDSILRSLLKTFTAAVNAPFVIPAAVITQEGGAPGHILELLGPHEGESAGPSSSGGAAPTQQPPTSGPAGNGQGDAGSPASAPAGASGAVPAGTPAPGSATSSVGSPAGPTAGPDVAATAASGPSMAKILGTIGTIGVILAGGLTAWNHFHQPSTSGTSSVGAPAAPGGGSDQSGPQLGPGAPAAPQLGPGAPAAPGGGSDSYGPQLGPGNGAQPPVAPVAPAPAPAAPVPAPAAPVPARAAPAPPQAANAIDLSGSWTMEWEWSVTDVYFVGTVSGGSGSYSFQGTLASGGNAEWSPKKGSATASCTLSGQPGTSSTASMSCTVAFAGGSGTNGSWSAQSQGQLSTMLTATGTKFEYQGSGQGVDQNGKLATVSILSLSPSPSAY
jgi:hypothetical protein